jgi:hypothetical protein
MIVTIELSSLPIFFIFFYIVLPVAIRIFKGDFWAKIYIFLSSLLGAMLLYASPLAFLRVVFPESIPVNILRYFELLLDWVTEGLSILLGGLGFFALFLLQYGLVKLVGMFGWARIQD